MNMLSSLAFDATPKEGLEGPLHDNCQNSLELASHCLARVLSETYLPVSHAATQGKISGY